MIAELVSAFISSVSININGQLLLNEELKDILPDYETVSRIDLNDEEEVEDYLIHYLNITAEDLGLIDVTQPIPYQDSFTYLDDKYSDYTWELVEERTTADVSNAYPIDMKNYSYFPTSDLNEAIALSGISSSYGGCAPIAMIGIGDYFARYLGYSQIMSDPTSSASRVAFATDVFEICKTWDFGDKGTLMFPWDYQHGFNDLMEEYNIDHIFSATMHHQGIRGGRVKAFDFDLIIEENIKKGIPVTLMTGLIDNYSGAYAKHTTNIFGYQKWVGIDKITGLVETRYLIMSRINRGDSYDTIYLYDDALMEYTMTYLVTYDISYQSNKYIYASDFANAFVNESGGGQYFYYEKSATILTKQNYLFNTTRLRCSYIEDQYLVLSSNKTGVEYAHLTFYIMHNVNRLTFDAGLWSTFAKEKFTDNDIFKIQYYDGSNWIDHIEINLKELSEDRDSLDTFIVLFNRKTTFRFYLEHANPSADRNKGRVVLDNIVLSYN